MPHNEKVTPAVAARLTGQARTTITRAIQRGELPADPVDIGGRTYHLIDMADLREYQRKREERVLSAPLSQERDGRGAA
ncbi:helix-turn-helix domain-containing protein [Nesterenkonia sp. CL21]|uniref:helix-turn-helix domain-containing protein n=1 Tax=Nesterenkonia sp. CL21 TaxID=3064894 RepID=UPI00287A7B99|nr:helix-turn-helix domain-containing protein [Nesterenkonia sp. CL21]MDS2172493.1 helix-turn-helix domain-containing protein [Nesterenkonia sp. CL21]